MKVAFVDVLGLPYDGNTLDKRGLGGSESAVIYMSASLAKLGFSITVFCECGWEDTHPGTWSNVTYKNLQDLANDSCEYDVIISSRSVECFVPDTWDRSWCKHPSALYSNLQKSSAHKVLWMHDTFCAGDHLLEQLVVQNYFQELFVLSDWHLSYVLNCTHGDRRNYEVLKNKTWITRNGVNIWIPYVDVSKKNPWQFVYNSSVSKGMTPLLEHIWPLIHAQYPEAQLKVIGGYYKFKSDQPPDEQEQTWHQLREKHDHKRNVMFTGIITQREIAHVLAESTAMIYPSAFPETFGISALESLCYHTPLITNRFGALEEVALDAACYKLNYAIEPNSLFPHIDSNSQVQEFVRMFSEVIENRYLLQQKQHACGIVKSWVTWDQVALQWKQHFFKVTDRMLSPEHFAQCDRIKTRINQIFGRRTQNPEDHQLCQVPEQPLLIISPFRNAEKYISRCIMSVATQQYSNVTHVLIDDASTDKSLHMAEQTILSCPSHVQKRIHLWKNTECMGAVANQYQALTWAKSHLPDHTIVCLLDGDDWLVNRNDCFHILNRHFDADCDFSYGSCWSLADQIPLQAQEYAPHIKQNKHYRNQKFNWIIPYTHLRAFRLHVFDSDLKPAWQSESGEWLRAGGDVPVFYSLIERVSPEKIKVMHDILVNYNDLNPLNDYKVNASQQTQTALACVGAATSQSSTTALLATPHVCKPQQVLLAVPTAKHIEVDTFKSMWDLHKPPGISLEFQYFYGYNIQQIRNTQVNWMLKNGFDHMLHVDSDMIFPPHTLEQLLHMQTTHTAITSGIYIQRKDHERVCEAYVHDPVTGAHVNVDLTQLPSNQCVTVDAVGFGCCLVRRDVYEQVGEPWFEYHQCHTGAPRISEDVDFCMKAQRKGFKTAIHTSLWYGHIHRTTLYPG